MTLKVLPMMGCNVFAVYVLADVDADVAIDVDDYTDADIVVLCYC